jgi:hypothetical protein
LQRGVFVVELRPLVHGVTASRWSQRTGVRPISK